jgi:Uma2 family endonuclease
MSTITAGELAAEMIGGEVLPRSTPDRVHQTVVLNLLLEMQRALPPILLLRSGPLEVRYGVDTVLHPDVMVIPLANYLDKESPLQPDLVIEVLSAETREIDLGIKKAAYRAAGCPSYWVIDPDERSVVGWDLVGGEYVEVHRGTGDEWVTGVKPYIFTLIPSALLRVSPAGLFIDD